MATKCTITDVLRDAAGDLLGGVKLTFSRPAVLSGIDGGAIIAPVYGEAQDAVTVVTTDETTAEFEVELAPGPALLTYQGPAKIERVSFPVPNETTSGLWALLDSQPAYTPTLVQQAGQYAAAAEAARDDAEAARDAAAGSASDAAADALAAAGSATAADGSATDAAASEAAAEGHADDAAASAVTASAASAAAVATVEAIPAAETALEDAITSADLETTVAGTTTRMHSPTPAAKMVVTPIFLGDDLDTAVEPVSVAVTGRNIVNPHPSLWAVGQINTSGADAASSSRLRTIGFIPVAPSTQYARSGGDYGRPVVTLYDAAGTFTRQLNITIGIADTWTTTADEVQMRLYFVKTGAVPTDAGDAEIQVERGAVATAFEAYDENVKAYDPKELYGYGGVFDEIIGSHHTPRILRRTLKGTADTGVFNIYSTILTSVPGYYVAQIEDPLDFISNIQSILVGRCDDGDFAQNAASTTAARGIWISSTLARIAVDTATIDAQAGANTFAKFQTYLDAHPVEVIFKVGSWAESEPVATGMLILPEYGSLVVTGAANYSIRFREIASGGSGGADLTGRVSTLEGTSTAHAALLSGLQDQIDDITVEGSIDPETAAARASFIGLTAASLKARLDRMEEVSGWVSITDFGATGDGTTDDSDAIQDAIDIAEAYGLGVRIPAASVAYLISRGMRLTKSTTVQGVPDGKIIKIPAYTSNVNGDISIDDTVIPVDDASGFEVGYGIYVGPSTSTTSYGGTRGVITAVNTGANTITIESYNSTTGTGIREAYADGEAVASMTFPMIYTDSVFSGSTPEISPRILGVHLDGNAQAGEPDAYTCSLIHLDQQHVIAPVVMHCILRNSAADAISDQGDGLSVLAFNRMYQNRHHGTHIGYTNMGAMVIGNYASENGVDGHYFCFNNSNTTVAFNVYEDCPIGIAEIGSEEKNIVIYGNKTIRCGLAYEITGARTGLLEIGGIISVDDDSVASAFNSGKVRLSGIATGCTGDGVLITRSDQITVDVDFYDHAGDYCVNIVNAAGERSEKIVVLGQMHGAAEASVRIQSSDNIYVAPQISAPASGKPDILYVTDGAYDAPDHIVAGPGLRLGTGISGTATNSTDTMA